MASQARQRQLVCLGLASAVFLPQRGLVSTSLTSPRRRRPAAMLCSGPVDTAAQFRTRMYMRARRLVIVACASFSKDDRCLVSFPNLTPGEGKRRGQESLDFRDTLPPAYLSSISLLLTTDWETISGVAASIGLDRRCGAAAGILCMIY
ncbi:hypothetical protein GGR52DRAFT_424374 [Hypoxylon sp. FL1284]|nr:hypothetical protein GGR52DRAFT_424374 [Hypoxylon sp. FL1284]